MEKNYHKKVKNVELKAVCISALYFFCVLSAYYIMRPLREQLIAQVGSSFLPIIFSFTFLVTLLLTPIFAWLISRWSRRIVLPLFYLFFIACQLAFVPFFNAQNSYTIVLGLIFFVWVSVFNLFVMSLFWSFMSDIWDDEQARRLFPLIAMGGTFGAIMGPTITRNLVEVIGISQLLLVSAGFLSIAIICIFYLDFWSKQHCLHGIKAQKGEAIGGSMFDGLKQLFRNRFIATISLLMVMGDAIGTTAYTLMTDYSGSTFPHDAIARTKLAANLDLLANSIQALLQITITRFLLVRFGAGTVLACEALLVAIACLVVAFVENPFAYMFGTLPWVALIQVASRAFSHGMGQPARESLFTMVPRELRYKGKNAVDTVVWRAGDIFSSLSINGLRVLSFSIAGFGILSALLVSVSGYIGWRLGNQTEKGKYQIK